MNARTPKIAVCAAFYAGRELMSFISDYPFRIQFVATCDRDTSDYEAEIAGICSEKNIECIRRVNVNDPGFIQTLQEREIDLMVLAWWPTIVHKEAIKSVNVGWLNTHPSLLPYGRGKHPYYWSIVEDTPFGVSLHLIDEKIDEGTIIFQKELPVAMTDTGETLYGKSVEANITLFKENYPKIVALDLQPVDKSNIEGTYHWGREIEEHSRIDLGKEYKASDLINLIRGRTFMTGNSAYFYHQDKKYLIKTVIEEAPTEASQ
jgi:methionyl-tRNA formyltransferase